MITESLQSHFRSNRETPQNYYGITTNRYRTTTEPTHNHYKINTEPLLNQYRTTSESTQHHYRINTKPKPNHYRIHTTNIIESMQNHYSINTESIQNHYRITTESIWLALIADEVTWCKGALHLWICSWRNIISLLETLPSGYASFIFE